MNLIEADKTIRDLMYQHGLHGWSVRWVNTRSRAGQCKHTVRELNFSRVLLRAFSDEEAMDTITHEIAHALVGPGHKHDLVWVRQHRALGGSGREHWHNIDVVRENHRWAGVCGVSNEKVYFLNRLTRKRQFGVTRCRCHNHPVKWVPNI